MSFFLASAAHPISHKYLRRIECSHFKVEWKHQNCNLQGANSVVSEIVKQNGAEYYNSAFEDPLMIRFKIYSMCAEILHVDTIDIDIGPRIPHIK